MKKNTSDIVYFNRRMTHILALSEKHNLSNIVIDITIHLYAQCFQIERAISPSSRNSKEKIFRNCKNNLHFGSGQSLKNA